MCNDNTTKYTDRKWQRQIKWQDANKDFYSLEFYLGQTFMKDRLNIAGQNPTRNQHKYADAAIYSNK